MSSSAGFALRFVVRFALPFARGFALRFVGRSAARTHLRLEGVGFDDGTASEISACRGDSL